MKMIWKCVLHIMKKKSVVAERFISTLKNKNLKYMTAELQNMHIDK